jgi:hypothetical protein
LCCLFFFDIRILNTPLVSFGHCVVCSSSIYWFWLPLWYLLAIVLSVLLRYTDSDYPFCIFKLFLHRRSTILWRDETNKWISLLLLLIMESSRVTQI